MTDLEQLKEDLKDSEHYRIDTNNKLADYLYNLGYRKKDKIEFNLVNKIINDVIPKVMYGNDEKALRLSFEINKLITKK